MRQPTMKTLFVCLLLLLASAASASAQQVRIVHIDVGQGDATLFVGPSKTLLYDGGLTGSGARIRSVLDALGLTSIDYFVAGHYHADHIGGIDELLNGGITLNLAFSGTLGTAPGISAQPASVTVNTGGAATFFVTATGTEPFAYQWFFNNTAISGATAPTHAVNNAQTANAGSYHVTVTNAAGSITSNTATLTVNTPPPPPPPSGGGGGGGGGGAPSLGFAGALLALVLVRRFFCPSRA